MTRLPPLAVFLLAVVHLLLFSAYPVSSRIYRTNDAVVIEVDEARPRPIPMTYAINPYSGYYHQQSNFPFWPYPLYKPASWPTTSDVENVAAASPQSKQSIACGVGPASPPQRTTPTVGIVGGTEAIPNSWPFVVGIRQSVNQILICGGSIISTTRVLTAAHCVQSLSVFDISTMTVSLGMHNQANNDAQQTRRVTRVVYHRDFNKKTWQNDVAVLTIDPPIAYSTAISPVCLPAASTGADLYAGKNATFMGWGLTSINATKISATLQQVTIPIVSQSMCNETYASYSISILNQHICAGANGKDTCHGDSGGPVVLQTKSGSTAWTQIAITSFGIDCPADSTMPSVYASVSFFRNWINTYMNS